MTEIEKGEKKLTKEKINDVINQNKFAGVRKSYGGIPISAGLWSYPSLINHDCLPNTCYFGIGDFYISHSTQEIKKGEEITVSYISLIDYGYEGRIKILKEAWKFDCNCSLCNYEEKKIKGKKTKKIKRLYEYYFEKFIEPEKNMESIVKEMKEFEIFLEENKKNFSCFELAKGYMALEIDNLLLNNFEKGQKYMDLTCQCCKGKNFLMHLLSQNYMLKRLSLLNCFGEEIKTQISQELLLKIVDTIKEYEPLNIEEIKTIIKEDAEFLNKSKNETKKMMGDDGYVYLSV